MHTAQPYTAALRLLIPEGFIEPPVEPQMCGENHPPYLQPGDFHLLYMILAIHKNVCLNKMGLVKV